ncbi:MAG: hypothetical protein K2Y18_03910 [Alphaproteobacteria bacterium]|jgi:hypothetical protein|nr:hypothetical protein [Alphaproteobacteria bacterium]
MICQFKKLRLSAIFVAILTGLAPVEASTSTTTTGYPGRTQGTSLGLGVGVKFLNLKNISTMTTSAAVPVTTRSYDAFANASSPTISVYARQYTPNLIFIPSFFGFEFDYLTNLKKNPLYFNFNGSPQGDTGYSYKENWDARAMFGVQLGCWSQLDFWAQVGLQVTYFEYEGITKQPNGVVNRFKLDNNLALAPAGGLEIRYSQPCLIGNRVVTDFILGWTAGYRNAFKVLGTAANANSYTMAMSSNFSHTINLKVMFRF